MVQKTKRLPFMKKFEFALSFLSICVLASCNTVVGAGRDLQDTVDWAHNRPSELGQNIGDAPAGYREQPVKKIEYPENTADTTENAQPADELQTVETSPAPPARSARRPLSASRNRLVWNRIDNYNAENPALPDGQTALAAAPHATVKTASGGEEIVQYGHDVQVFPVNGDVSPYTEVNAVHGGYVNGELVQQVFFAHGSSTVSKIERKNLHELAQSLVHNSRDYKIDVVGHASHRVNHIHDPIQKKMINFKIAQKRANAVTAELLKAGISPNWVVASSMGDEQPNMRRNGKSQEAADRRAEVYLSNE